MKRLITYLYEYHNGKKGSNAGFLKLDSRGNDCRVQLHLQGNRTEDEKGDVFIVVKQDREEGILLGEIRTLRGSCEGMWMIQRNQLLNSPYQFSQIQGIAIIFPSGRYLASSWVEDPDEDFMRGTFSVWKPNQEKIREERNIESEEQMQQKNSIDKEIPAEETEINAVLEETVLPEDPVKEEHFKESENLVEIEPVDSGNREKTDSHLNRINGNHPGKDSLQEEKSQAQAVPEQIRAASFTNQKAADNSQLTEEAEPVLQRIELNDIHKLPKRNWHLCNNSFLIHGFFNYHYLVLKKVSDHGITKMYLGVPGIYEKPERAMALLFGFSEFEEADRKNPAKQGNVSPKWEDIPEGTHGYWFCLLDV